MGDSDKKILYLAIVVEEEKEEEKAKRKWPLTPRRAPSPLMGQWTNLPTQTQRFVKPRRSVLPTWWTLYTSTFVRLRDLALLLVLFRAHFCTYSSEITTNSCKLTDIDTKWRIRGFSSLASQRGLPRN